MNGQSRAHLRSTAKLGEGGTGEVRRFLVLLFCICGLALCCSRQDSEPSVLTATQPLHLEEHLQDATLEGSALPSLETEPIDWSFDSGDHGWTPVAAPGYPAIELHLVEGGLQLPLRPENLSVMDSDLREGYLYTELPDLRFEDWSHVEITARAVGIRNMGTLYNYTEDDPMYPDDIPFQSSGGRAAVMSDGTIQTYRLPLDSPRRRPWGGSWTHLGLWFNALAGEESPALDLLSIRLISAESEFAMERAGVHLLGRTPDESLAHLPSHRRSLFVHAPGKIVYRVLVPEKGRLDTGLSTLTHKAPVTFSVTATPTSGESVTLFKETLGDPTSWVQRTIDLAPYAGETISLTLAVESNLPGSVAFWAAPILSGSRLTESPNVILYIIDGGGADYMSVYDYGRDTTPNLTRLAAEGAVFERAHSNSSWTRPSTLSLLTSLQSSAFGGLVNGRNIVPDQVLTLAEHMHRAGYQTAEFTTNTNAGSISGLDRGNDVFRESGVENYSNSSTDLHDNYWAWRSAYPGEPYWVHFQTTDVHNPHTPTAPFAGLFIDPERRRLADKWTAGVEEIPETDDVRIGEALDLIGADRTEYWTAQRDLHDECLAHQDHQIGQMVSRLKASREWEHTLLIVAADHSVAAGSWDYELLTRHPEPSHVYHDDPATPILRPGVSRIPLIVVWPGHIAPGQRFSEPVSLLDLLPTILDLTDLPAPEIKQGHSLAPLLLGDSVWEPQPTFFDEFEVDGLTHEIRGRIEVIDGGWGASLLINEDPEAHPRWRRPAPLLLYDLEKDPLCLTSLHEERPDLVEKYRRLLQRQFKAHRDLGSLFEAGEQSPLDPEQLEMLRSLGYIQ